MPEALHYLGMYELRVGSPEAADAHFLEEKDFEALTRRQGGIGNVGHLMVLAWQGRESEVRNLASTLAAAARTHCWGWSLARIEYAVALLELSLGNYGAAPTRVADDMKNDIALRAFSASDAIEAHARGGNRHVALSTIDTALRPRTCKRNTT